MLLKIVRDDVYGRHASDIPPSAQTNGHIQACRDQIRDFYQTGRRRLFQTVMAASWFSNLASISTKVSLLILYMRIFKVASVAVIFIWAGIVFITLFYIVCLIAYSVFCFPHGGEDWLEAANDLRCGPPLWRLAAVQGVVGIITNFDTLVIPFILVLRLQMTGRRKTAVAGIFVTGLL